MIIVVILLIASLPFTSTLFIGLPLQQLYAVNDNKYATDSGETSTGQELAQENVGGSSSFNFNCAGQFISGVTSGECHSDADNGNGPNNAFTIIVVSNEGQIQCKPPLPPGDSFLAAIAEGDGTVTGNYTITHIGMITQQRTGDTTTATTDGNTFSITAENLGFCSDLAGEITISGECGEDVVIRYEDPSAVGIFTGDVECMHSA